MTTARREQQAQLDKGEVPQRAVFAVEDADGTFLGQGAVIGAAGVAVRDAKPWTVTVGNPGREIAMRKFEASPSESETTS